MRPNPSLSLFRDLPVLTLLVLAVCSRPGYASESKLAPWNAHLTPGIRALPEVGVLFDRPAGDSGPLWARGNNYKACFDTGGTTFLPYLGSSVARREGQDSLTFRLEAVELDGQRLAFARDVLAQRDGQSVRFDRGALSEVYLLEAESMEQLFVFDELPAVGELVLRVAVEGDCESSVDGQGLRFTTASGGATYSSAIAVGALGRRLGLSTRHEAGQVEIRVPREAVAEMEFPLVIDPVISSFTVYESDNGDLRPDAVFLEHSGLWYVVWENSYDATDHDVLSCFVDTSGAVMPGSVIVIDVSTEDWRAPKVAYNASADLSMVVAETGTYPNRAISGRVRSTGSVGLVFPVSDSAPSDCSHPDIGGDPLLGGQSSFLAVWAEDTGIRKEIHARSMDPFGAPLSTPVQVSLEGQWCVTPSISNSCGQTSARGWVAVWTRVQGSGPGSTYHIDWGKFGADGVLDAIAFPVYSSGSELQDPVVSSSLDAGDGQIRCLIAWSEDVGGSSHIVGKVLRGSTQVAPPVGGLDLTTLLGGDASTEQFEPSVDSDGAAYVLAYTERTSGLPFADNDVYVASLSLSGDELLLSEGPNALQASSGLDGNVSISAEYSSGAEGHRYLAAWTDGQFDFSQRVSGAVYDGPGLGAPYCTGVINSAGTRASIQATGSPSMAPQDWSLTLRVSGCPPNKPGLFFFGTSQLQAPFGDGLRCVGGQVQRIYPAAPSNGAGVAEREVLFGSNPAAALFHGGNGVNYQYWYRDPSGGPSGFNLSNGLHVVHLP